MQTKVIDMLVQFNFGCAC